MEKQLKMGHEIKVSVLLLSYCQEGTLRQALESILAQQTDFAFEILVGDDASTDRTQELIAAMAGEDGRIVPVLRKENLGASRNLFDLIGRARGQYLAYLEGDDYWCDGHKLQKQVDFLETHPDYIACTHRVLVVDAEGKPARHQRISWLFSGEEYRLADFRGLRLPGHMSSLVQRNFFKEAGDDYRELITMHPMISDRALALLLAARGPIRQLPDRMSCYRVADSGSGATAQFYFQNANWLADDYAYTRQLERYARDILHVDAGFSHHRSELFVSALWRWARRPTKENRQLIRLTAQDGQALLHLLRTPAIVLKKAACKYF